MSDGGAKAKDKSCEDHNSGAKDKSCEDRNSGNATGNEIRFLQHLNAHGQRRCADFVDGILAYRRQSDIGFGARRGRHREQRRVIWRDGDSTLRDYGTGGKVPLLVVPSLVNRAWILDLIEGQGFLSYMAENGIHPLLLDWGEPGDAERCFGFDAYIARLTKALAVANRFFARPPILLGYCMGGNLAMAAAVLSPRMVGGLVLLATPWDFHVDGQKERMVPVAMARQMIDAAKRYFGTIPVDVMQMFFMGHNPFGAAEKFRNFTKLDDDARYYFTALEDWLNDGVDLTVPLARQCLLEWYDRNDPAQGRWKVSGRIIDPARWTGRSLAVIPSVDRIVPPQSSMALARLLVGGACQRPELGHVGLMASRRAKDESWSFIGDWIRTTGLAKADS